MPLAVVLTHTHIAVHTRLPLLDAHTCRVIKYKINTTHTTLNGTQHLPDYHHCSDVVHTTWWAGAHLLNFLQASFQAVLQHTIIYKPNSDLCLYCD